MPWLLDRDDVTAAHAQIQELFGKIKDIQRKAEESENMVQEICRCAAHSWDL